MTIDRIVFVFAGSVILASLALAQVNGPHRLRATALVWSKLLQSAFSGFCPLVRILRRLGVGKSGAMACGTKAQ